MKKLLSILMLIGVVFTVTACNDDDAKVVNKNLAKAADQFEVMRRVVMENTWTGETLMVTEGLCSLTPHTDRVWVTCKVGSGDDDYIRNDYYKSRNVAIFAEQMGTVKVNAYHYRRTFKPQTILPDIDFRGNGGAFVDAITPDDGNPSDDNQQQ